MDAHSLGNETFHIPESLRLGHDEFRAELVRATLETGAVGEAAKRVARLCLPHFEAEEKAVFPVFGLLHDLAFGDVRPEMAAILPLISRFSAWHDTLGHHHENIVSAVGELLEAAHKEENREMADFAYNLRVQERIADEVIYPTVLLIGNYIKERLDA
jgi:hypothetical protein